MWNKPKEFENLIPRLGGMHFLMSFIGCVGALMATTGIVELLEHAFASVSKMLSGKLYPSNFRALRLLVEVLLQDVLKEIDNDADFMKALDDLSTKSATTAAWVKNLIHPVLLMMLFTRAEREGDWSLHLYCVWILHPYSFAANHHNYAPYGVVYYLYMCQLPAEILDRFLKGEHVMRHIKGHFNAICLT